MSAENINNSGKAKILLVEDEANIAKLFSYNLKKAGYDFQIAVNGGEGFKMAKSYRPDLIISDIMMPEVDGFEFRRMLLKDPVLKSIPFIFLTAKGSEDDILEGYGLDIEDYIIKTSSAKVVLAKVSALLASRAKERDKVVDEVHKAADNMGATVVPADFPEFEGFEVRHWHQTYQNVPGGDFIDYVKMGDDHLAVILGDVMGKKWGAWYFAVAYAGYVRSAIRFALKSSQNLLPSEILKHVNESVFNDERISEVFITLSVVVLDKKSKTAYYSGAGDLPLIWKSDTADIVQSGGLLLGFTEETTYEDRKVELKPGDSLYLTTDGIIESPNDIGEQFGKNRFIDVIAGLSSSDDPIEKIKEAITEFTQGKFGDDVSLIVMKAL